MKELNIDRDSIKILKSLKKDGFVVVKPICMNCLNELLAIVYEHYLVDEVNVSRMNAELLYVLYIKAKEFKEMKNNGRN